MIGSIWSRITLSCHKLYLIWPCTIKSSKILAGLVERSLTAVLITALQVNSRVLSICEGLAI